MFMSCDCNSQPVITLKKLRVNKYYSFICYTAPNRNFICMSKLLVARESLCVQLPRIDNFVYSHIHQEMKEMSHRLQARIQGGGIWGTCPPLEPNAQRKNLRRLKDLRGQIQQKSPKFSKWIFFFFFFA